MRNLSVCVSIILRTVVDCSSRLHFMSVIFYSSTVIWQSSLLYISTLKCHCSDCSACPSTGQTFPNLKNTNKGTPEHIKLCCLRNCLQQLHLQASRHPTNYFQSLQHSSLMFVVLFISHDRCICMFDTNLPLPCCHSQPQPCRPWCHWTHHKPCIALQPQWEEESAPAPYNGDQSINQLIIKGCRFTGPGCTVLGEHMGLHRHLKHETGWKIASIYAASASLPVASSDDRSNGTMASSVKEPLPMALFTGLPTLTANSYKSTSFVDDVSAEVGSSKTEWLTSILLKMDVNGAFPS